MRAARARLFRSLPIGSFSRERRFGVNRLVIDTPPSRGGVSRTLRLNHLHPKTRGPEATARFYVDTLGAKIVSQSPNGGSVLRGTVFNRREGVSTYLKVESGEPADRLAHRIRNAKAGCFAKGLTTQQVPLHSHIEVNGNPFPLEGVTTQSVTAPRSIALRAGPPASRGLCQHRQG